MGSKQKLAAIILAGGFSTRAPGFKPMLPLGDLTILEAAVANFRKAAVDDIVVVTGHRAQELKPVLDSMQVRVVFNSNYTAGMFSSVLAGAQALQPGTDAFFLLPADMPLVRSRTIKLVRQAGLHSQVVYPVFQGQRGHPPLISTQLIPNIVSWQGLRGLQGCLETCASSVREVAVLDEGILLDLDTPADYERMLQQRDRDIPTEAECQAIFARMGVVEKIIRHGQMVSQVACRLAEQLNQGGLQLNVELVRTGGLLHDLAKGKPDHARLGGKVLLQLGYPKVAAVIACHTDITWEDGICLNEAAVVYLADKLVQQDRIVSVRDRFQAALDRYGNNAEILPVVRRRLLNSERISAAVESLAGCSIEAVLARGKGAYFSPIRSC